MREQSGFDRLLSQDAARQEACAVRSDLTAPEWLSILWRRGLPGLTGFALIVLAIVSPQFRQPSDFLKPAAWFVVVSGLAMILVGAGQLTRWQRAAALLALALAGQACSLQLIDAGQAIRLQHYFAWRDMLGSFRVLFLLGLIGQTAIVVRIARSAWPEFKQRLPRLLTAPQAAILLACLSFAGVTFSRSPLRYGAELMLAGWIYTINALNLALVVAAMPGDGLRGLAGWLEGRFALRSRSDRLLPWLAAGWVVTAASALSWLAFDRIPHIPDEVAYLFQAKYFAYGRLCLPAPPDAAAFAIPHTINDGARWYSIFPPGWPVLLAFGFRLGAPWLVNPLLAGATVLLAHKLIARLYTRAVAHIAVGLLALSPMFLFMSASLMSHPLSVVCLLIAWLGVHNARSGGAGWGAIAGLALGWLVLTRPFEGVLIGMATGIWALGVWGRRLTTRALLALGLTSVAVGGLVLPYNRALTGRALYDPITKYFDEKYYPGCNRLGFGADIGNVGWTGLDPLPGHGPLDAAINANQNMYMLNFDLFGWSYGSLIFVVLVLLWGKRCASDRIFLGLIIAIVGGHSFYWFSGGPDIGARYWYQALLPLVVLTVRGVEAVREQLSAAGSAAAHRLWMLVALASAVAFINVVPWRALDKYHHYRGMRADIRKLSRDHDFGHSLVLIRSASANPFPEYSSAAIFNPPSLDRPGTIYARDLGPQRSAALREHFADRAIWIVAAPSLTGEGMRVMAGPLFASSRAR